MDSDPDPISELRETLRRRAVTSEAERAPRRSLTVPQKTSELPRPGAVAPRSVLANVRLPELRPQQGIHWRRGGVAISRMLRSAWPFVVAVVAAFAVAAHWVARAAGRALSVIAHALRAGGGWLRRSGTWAVAIAARTRARRTVQPAVVEVSPVEPEPILTAAEKLKRHLEELERRQLEQRIDALGPDHPDVAILLQLAAERCAARGAAEEALALYGRALGIQEATFGPDSPALRPLLGDLAELEQELGHDGDALLHRARREMLEPRAAGALDRVRVDGVFASRTSDTSL